MIIERSCGESNCNFIKYDPVYCSKFKFIILDFDLICPLNSKSVLDKHIFDVLKYKNE